jgi:predicted alpha/beta-fold hydrolase
MTELKREKRMAWIGGSKANDEKVDIPHIHKTFLHNAYIINPLEKHTSLNKLFQNMIMGILLEDDAKNMVKLLIPTLMNAEILILPQLTINTLSKDINIAQLIKKCHEVNELNNWFTKEIHIVFK